MNLRPPLSLLAILTAAVGLMVSSHQARASVTLSFDQVGPDVVATYSGSWSSWEGSNNTFDDPFTVFGSDRGSDRFVNVDGEISIWFNAGLTIPAEWPNRSVVVANSSSGQAFGFLESGDGILYAPANYSAGTPFSGSMTFSNRTLSNLLFTEGDFGTISTGGGTINYTVGAIPEPSSYGFLLGAVGLATAVFCRRRRARTD